MIADEPLVRLSELAVRFGDGLAEDAERCERLLAQVCSGDFDAERAALVAAVDKGVTGDLVRARHGSEPPGALLSRLCARLEEAGLSAYWARWSVEGWALALRVVPESERLMVVQTERLALLIEESVRAGAVAWDTPDRLVSTAKAFGIGEAETRGYLSRYVVRHGWRLPDGTTGALDAPPEAAPEPAFPQVVLPDTSVEPRQPGPIIPAAPWGVRLSPASARPFRLRWATAIAAALVLLAAAALIATAPDRQRQAETERQQQAETERLRQAEAERQQRAEAERQRQAEAERQRQTETERLRQAEAERQQRAEAERQRQTEAERQRQVEAERQRQAEIERQRQAEAERQRLAEIERQRLAEIERQC